jgi:hypothetical protein
LATYGGTSLVHVELRAKNRSLHRGPLEVGQTTPSVAEQDAEVLSEPARRPAGDHSTSHPDIAWSSRGRCARVISLRRSSSHRLEASPRHRCGEIGGGRCGWRGRVSGRLDVSNHEADEGACPWRPDGPRAVHLQALMYIFFTVILAGVLIAVSVVLYLRWRRSHGTCASLPSFR